MLVCSVTLILGFIQLTTAAVLSRQGAVTALSASQISAFKPYTFYASAGACSSSATRNWTCGASCDANPGFLPIAAGGDGAVTQFWFVGYDPALNTIVVSHQGTDNSKIIPLLTDADFFLTSLDPNLFPGISSSVEVHDGFHDTHARSAPSILAAVQKGLAAHPTASVTLVGHSLGAAIALIDAVYLPLHLPSSTKFKYVGYGLPRVGNPAFASYLDSHFPDLTHINNKEDPVPGFPPERLLLVLKFQHPHGEVHIQDNGEWDSCAGNENPSSLCFKGDVNLLTGNVRDHGGPYDGVMMGCHSG